MKSTPSPKWRRYSPQSYAWKKTCSFCKSQFTWQTTQGGVRKTCSQRCSFELRLLRNKSYGDRHSKEYYESIRLKRSAYMRYYNRVKMVKVCASCEKEFTTMITTQKYCGSVKQRLGCSYKNSLPQRSLKVSPAPLTYKDYVEAALQKAHPSQKYLYANVIKNM